MQYYFLTFRLVIQYLNRYPLYWLYMFIRAIYITLEVFTPILIGYIINLLTSSQTDWNNLSIWVGLFITIVLISPILEVGTSSQCWFIGWRVGRDFRKDTIDKLKYAGLNFWENKDRGAVLKTIDKAYEDFSMLAALLSHTYLWIFGKITGMFIANIFINPVVVIFYIVNIILFSTNLYMLLPKEDKLGIIERRGQESVNSRIMEYLVNFKTVVYLNLFKRQEKEIDFYNKDAYQKYCKREVISSWKWYLNNQLHNLTTIAIFVYGLIQVSNGNLKVGTLATLIIFSISYAEHLGWLMEQMDELIRYVNSLQRWQETFGNIKEDNKLLTPTKGIQFDKLKINNLSVQREDRETLSKVSFDLNKGDKLAVVGFTGSGKSTLLDVILKVIIDYQGEIKLGDIDYKDLKVVDITNVFSIVPQEVQLFRDTVKGNILASRPDYDKSIDDLLKTSCLLDLIKKLPQGLDQPIHEGSTNVSGGERQRIGIARALIEEQPVLVLDEATASLDPKTERDVITNIINKYPDLTVIYITHKYSLLDYFDKILVMNEGRVVEKGSFEELKSKGGLFSDLFEASQV